MYYESRENSEKDSTQGVTGMKAAVTNMKEAWKEQIQNENRGIGFEEGSKRFQEAYKEPEPSECTTDDE